ncbi:MAG: class II aldolase/adducin family protein [Burkholderiaceae bacterium]|nr:class II aldolase/adducin family protein [Burkholderiaceae bacterium]
MPEAVQRFRCEDDARAALLAAARELRAGGTAGSASLSLRWSRSAAAGMLTVGAPVAATATVDAVAWVPLDGGAERTAVADTGLPPDWRLHRGLLGRRGRISAIVRSRPVSCMAIACSAQLRKTGIPAFHPDDATGDAAGIRCAQPTGLDCATLVDQVEEALGERAACLLAGEGLVTIGPTLDAAVAAVATVETLAEVWWRLLQAGHGEVHGVAI